MHTVHLEPVVLDQEGDQESSSYSDLDIGQNYNNQPSHRSPYPSQNQSINNILQIQNQGPGNSRVHVVSRNRLEEESAQPIDQENVNQLVLKSDPLIQVECGGSGNQDLVMRPMNLRVIEHPITIEERSNAPMSACRVSSGTQWQHQQSSASYNYNTILADSTTSSDEQLSYSSGASGESSDIDNGNSFLNYDACLMNPSSQSQSAQRQARRVKKEKTLKKRAKRHSSFNQHHHHPPLASTSTCPLTVNSNTTLSPQNCRLNWSNVHVQSSQHVPSVNANTHVQHSAQLIAPKSSLLRRQFVDYNCYNSENEDINESNDDDDDDGDDECDCENINKNHQLYNKNQQKSARNFSTLDALSAAHQRCNIGPSFGGPSERRGGVAAETLCARLVECRSLEDAIRFVDKYRSVIDNLTRIITHEQPAYRNYDFSQLQIDLSAKEAFNASFWLDRDPILTTADGNCQYHAVSLSLTGSEDYTANVRLAATVAVIDNRDWFDQTLALVDRGTVLSMIKTIARNYSWGDEMTLVAVAIAIRKRIYLYTCNFGKQDFETVKLLSLEELQEAFRDKRYRGGTGIHAYAEPLCPVPEDDYIMFLLKNEHFIAILPHTQNPIPFRPYNPIVPNFN